MKTITICASASFYEHVIKIKEQLEGMGYKVLVPQTSLKMQAAGSFEREAFVPPPGDIEWKAKLMHDHFDEVDKGNICLVINDDKHGIKNYIGGNVLMEMAVAFHQRKPIVMLHELPKESSFMDELVGMDPILLHGKIEDLPEALKKRQ